MSRSDKNKNISVCAVIVTYNIGERITKVLTSISPQIDHIVIVDNGSNENNLTIIKDFCKSNINICTFILNEVNNLASAQNIGIKYAIENEYDSVLLLDHDSISSTNMVENLKKYMSFGVRKIGIIAPYLTDENSRRKPSYAQKMGIFFRRRKFNDEDVLQNILGVMSSGSLIPVDIFADIGFMDEDLCIDYIDKDFCLRLVEADYDIIAVRSAVLHHRLGDSCDHKIWCLNVTTTNHPANRLHYIFRNRIISWKRYGINNIPFLLHDICAICYDIIRIIFFENDKFAKLREIFRGIIAGIKYRI